MSKTRIAPYSVFETKKRAAKVPAAEDIEKPERQTYSVVPPRAM